MKKQHQTYCRSGAGIALLVCSTLALGASQVPPSAPVTVVNTPANPVPITGSTSVSGAVSISGTVPVTQSGTWNVGVAGTTKTKNIDELGRNPFVVQASCRSDNAGGCIASVPPVPDGKRFVVEYVSASMQVRTLAGAVGVQNILLSIENADHLVNLAPRLVGSAQGTENYVASERVLMFVEAGQVLQASFAAWQTIMSGSASLSGYLIDLSQ